MAPPDSPPLSVPELLAGAALVALVPATDDLTRAAAAAWAFARHVAAAGRRVALVDCYVDTPWLHGVAGEPNGDGIVDVFEYGVSLSHIARAQPEPTLFFVPAGTISADPMAMMANPRWKRLAAGFRHEGALMLLFLPPETIGAIGTELDGLVALAPDGAEAGLAATPEIQAAVDGGLPLLAKVTDEGGIEAEDRDGAVVTPRRVTVPGPAAEAPEVEATVPADKATPPAMGTTTAAARTPAAEATTPAAEASAPGPEPPAPALRAHWHARPAPPRGRWLVLGFVALGLVGVGAAMLVRLRPHGAPQGPRPAPQSAAAPRTAAPAPPPRPAAAPPPAARPADSLPFAVQVSAWTRLGKALADGNRLAARRLPSLIAPITIRSRLWYRVYAGPVASRPAGDSLLAAVRAAGLDASRKAAVAFVPLSFTIGTFPSESAARTAGRRLRTRGVPTFVLGRADGSFGLLAGAYATARQAADFGRLLTSTGNAGPLGPRVGTHP